MSEKVDQKKSKLPYYYGSKPNVSVKARKLRKDTTPAELLFWKVIRNGKLDGFKFRRQHPVSGFIVDFYCHELKLVVEIDGDIHEVDEVLKRDKERENVIMDQGLNILRFTNEEVLSDIGKVIEKISSFIKKPHPALSYEAQVSKEDLTLPSPMRRGMKKAIFCWSGGKDSSYALYKVLQAKEYEITTLFTTVNENFKRVSMHGVREELIDEQAKSIGLPLSIMYVSTGSNDEYERKMEAFLSDQKAKGVEYVIFGDIFLEDLRAYRDNNLGKVGMKGVYPLWKMDTTKLAHDFIDLGFKTILCCTNDAYLGEKEVGSLFDDSFFNNLPANVDPCGENGEFHTFCFEGPIFRAPIKVEVKEKIYRPLEIKTDTNSVCNSGTKTQGFWFCELSHA